MSKLQSALANPVWRQHKIGTNYTMDGKPGWKIAYYPLFECGKTGEVYAEPRALVEKPMMFGTDFREVPLRYLSRKNELQSYIAFVQGFGHYSPDIYEMNYELDGEYCIISGAFVGISNHTILTFTAPFFAMEQKIISGCDIIDNGVRLGKRGGLFIDAGSNVIDVLIDGRSGMFACSGSKGVKFSNLRIKIR